MESVCSTSEPYFMDNLTSTFSNEPLMDFTNPANVDAMHEALAQVKEKAGKKYPCVIGTQEITSSSYISSSNPARHKEVVGEVAAATAAQAAQAVEVAHEAFASWKQVPVEERALLLQTVAAKLRERKFEFSAWLVSEVSKNWNEAHAEVGQAIDFCEYYAWQAGRLECPEELQQPAGESAEWVTLPLGAGVVLAPWNFPLSILCGTTLAPVVAGNTVVMKPSPRSPVIAALFFQLLQEAEMPPGVVNFIVGNDSEIGNALVDHPLTRFVSFTGSKAVGLQLHERLGKVPQGQKHFKRAVLEMGGKGTIIVDETADLDEAADNIAVSAFGYQGQKCSACTRVVALTAIHDKLLQKLVERVGRLLVSDPTSPNIALGALIDERAYDQAREYLTVGRSEGHLSSGGIAKKDTGYFMWPTIFAGVKPQSRLSQEEIFAPILTMLKARDFNEALQIANDTDYGLTGGVFSQNEERLAKAREEFEVGNLYFNRRITGGFVGSHPLGGFKLSGDGSKAGGPQYLSNFVQSKVVARAWPQNEAVAALESER